LNLSKRRITVSTCGICDSLFDIAQNGPFMRLALSLTTADETLRQKLMPITKNNPLEKIKEALKLFQDNSGGRITLEIPLLGGINTRDIDAASIADFAKGLETVINIIPWNPADVPAFENKPLCKPEKKETANFISLLEKQGLKVTMRLHKGQKINGACGQLGSLA
jgi:23S rRNA (adenine2503-C2)-methyltransferase